MADERFRVLARKWRPATFSEVVGQEHVCRSLTNAIRLGRIHHAFLFCGPRGVGKTTVARILAKALNCVDGPTATPCLSCYSCKSIADGSSLDVMEIDGASNNNVDQVRDLRETLGYATAQSRYRVIIIDEVHMLSKAAFNALLKSLEEPPPHVVFIFATTEATKVIPTVQSRCQRYDFRRLSTRDIRDQLTMICREEKVDVEPAGIDLIAQYADGAMRDGQSLLDQVIAATEGHVTASEVADLIGAVERTVFFDLVDAIARRDVSATISAVADTVFRGRSLAQFLTGLMSHLRCLLACAANARNALSDFEPEELERLSAQARKFCDRDILRMLSLAADAESLLEKSAVPQVRVELALLKMVYMEKSVELSDLVGRLDTLLTGPPAAPPHPVARGPAPPETAEARTATISTPSAVPAKRIAADVTSPDHPPPVRRESEEDQPGTPGLGLLTARWPDIVDSVKSASSAVPWFHQVRPTGIDGDTVILEVDGAFFAERVSRMDESLLGAIRAHFPAVRRLSVRAVDKSSQNSDVSETVRRAGSLIQGVVEEEPVIGKLIESLGLELIE
ncbi:MAG TPA: DNA polymerase III subunit gamma/tau [Candidatus Latescibacteria bacterium]|nr:DNA polymerase III subunit gamma/tau [Candidatus Latescibacterota bacterium]HOS63621.1 DNA polymerase III subunit gamma/tau [Candidatus Latescibacterota bacterium]HPK73371.1 DNA polymerase III subunit gamma/tau [Candidatus Latescibacterota bacterium]